MRRGVNEVDALETINAAATAIASAEARGARSVQKRWGSCFNISWCFGSNKNKRLGRAAVIPEITITEPDTSTVGHQSQPPSIVLPFVAPPSSPASFLPSESPSAVQSPTGILSVTSSISANMYSPGGPSSIFAIGPYAYETLLVSPPVFSTFTTEPSTAPYTPPPESVHLTTPSSPEVPFARLLEPTLPNGEADQRYTFSQYEFHSYQFQPGSPLSHLISPSSGISGSGTSSPFPDREFNLMHPSFPEFRIGNPPKLLDLEKIVLREWESRQGSGVVTPNAMLHRQTSDVAPLPEPGNGLKNVETMGDQRVSFEITAEDFIRFVEVIPVGLHKQKKNVDHIEEGEEGEGEEGEEEEAINMANWSECQGGETSHKSSVTEHFYCESNQKHRKNRELTLGSSREFNFSNADGTTSDEPGIGSSDWWANEKVITEEGSPCKNWSFFPVIQTGAS